MITPHLTASLLPRLRGKALPCQPLSEHTTFRIGGPADLLLIPEDLDDLQTALGWLAEQEIPWKVIGNGSNLLVCDRGIGGAVVKLGQGFRSIEVDGESLVVGAAAHLARVGELAARLGLSGLESTAGIPGTMGGALVTNAGTDTGCIGDLVEQLTLLSSSGEVRQVPGCELDYGYRCSGLAQAGVVLEARLSLRRAPQREIREKISRLHAKRASRQPLGRCSAGSVFKNHPAVAAGKLLDQAGAKGARCGQAEVSSKHANFILNLGGASAAQVRELMEEMRRRVEVVHSIPLELEIELVGE